MNPDNYTNDNEVIELRLQLHHEKCRADNLWEVVKFERAENARLKAECQARQAENSVLAVECDSLKAEVERLTKGHSTDFVRAEMYRHLLDENAKLKEEVMRMRNDDYKEGDILQKCCEHQKNRIERLKAEVERLTSDLQMEKENEDRLVREWQKANNEVYGLQRQVAALIDDQTRLKAEVADLKSDADRLKADNVTKA